MQIIHLKYAIIYIFCLSNIFISCKRQTAANIEHNNANQIISVGDIVAKLPDNLWYIYQDKKNNYWFSSNGNGAFCYDGKNILNFSTKNGLANDTVRQIQADEFGNIYFSTFGGINKFDGKKIITLQAIKSKDWKSEPKDLWFSILGRKNEHGPYRYDGENLYNLEFPKHYLHDEFHENGINPFFSPYEIYTIYKDRKGAMWFGTSVFGACRFDGKSIKWMYETDLTIVPNGGSFGIRAIFEDKKGEFWICNTLHRYIFDIEKTNKSDRLQYQKSKGIGNAKIFAGDEYIYYSHIVEDNNGDIWLTTWSQGIYKYDGENITHYPVKEGEKNVNVVSMYKDNRGDLWLGTPENGIFKFDGKAFQRFKL